MQATNSTNTSATLNGYSLTAVSPTPGVDPPISAPSVALGPQPQANRAGPLVGRRLLGGPHPGVHLGSGWQQQLGLSSFSPDSTTKLSLRGLLAVLSQHAQRAQHAQHAQQLLSKTKQALDAAVVKLAGCAVSAAQHAQRAPQHAQQLLSWTTQALNAAVSKLADCAAAAPQHAQQLLSRTRQAVNAAVSKHAGHAAAVHALLHHQAAQLLDSLGRAVHRRAMAASTPDSVEVDVTVNVPSGQSQSATQARIEGPSFAPALQQSLSNAGMMVQRHASLGGMKRGREQGCLQWSCPFLLAFRDTRYAGTTAQPAMWKTP